MILQITRVFDSYLTQNDAISMQKTPEITFDIFEILLNFCFFLIFLEIPKVLNTRFWLRHTTFKVEDMVFTKESKT